MELIYPVELKDIIHEKCTVCLESLIIKDQVNKKLNDKNISNIIKLNKCNHKFHRDCITPWLEHNFTCPICRMSYKN